MTADQNVGGNIYFNSCSKISVKNCTGPVYIRNFHVDGETVRDIGIEITNSDVVLENCGSVRCKEAGFKFNNSKVILSRSAFAYRNYNLLSTTTRKNETGAGFHFVNSEVTVSSNPQSIGSTGIGDTGALRSDCKIISSRNYAGFILENSILKGGLARSSVSDETTGSIISSELNTGYGFICDNSKLDIQNLLDLYGNNIGSKSENTSTKFNFLCVEAQGNEGIICSNSKFIFDSSANPTAAGQSDRAQLQMSGNSQHIVLNDNSNFEFVIKDNTPNKYGFSRFLDSHGAVKAGGTILAVQPSIFVSNNSNLKLIHTKILKSINDSVADKPCFGQAISAENSSKVCLFGTVSGCTFIFGPEQYDHQQYVCALYGRNSSEFNIHGPTAIGQYGIDILVENNSTINIEPAKGKGANGLGVVEFDLSTQGNHTSVELHSTRACLVANKNSTINMQDCGSFPAHWSRTASGLAVLDSGFDYPIDTFGTSSYTGSGSIQFYPNPQDATIIDDNNLDDLATAISFIVPVNPKFTAETGMNSFFIKDDPLSPVGTIDRTNITKGGVCVRAVEDSVVNVTNVHFPLGSNNSPLDGIYYDASGSECCKFMIWNIADTSRLNASFLSVSGMYPIDSQYHGPSAFWASSADGVSYTDVPAYGAPKSTNDTGSLSVLDSYGAGSSVLYVPIGVDYNSPFDRFNYTPIVDLTAYNNAGLAATTIGPLHYGSKVNTYENRGPFRIYWTPKSSSKILQNDLSGYFKGAWEGPGAGYTFSGAAGPAYQVFAQGYNCSAALSAVPVAGEVNASSLYPDLLKLSKWNLVAGSYLYPTDLWTSGFYYCSEFLEDNPTQCMLDESASYTFANSRNASLGSSGRPKRVTIYRSRGSSSRGSESYPGDVSGTIGFKSAGIFDLKRDN